MGTFKAIRIDKADKGTVASLTQFDESEWMEGDVVVAVAVVVVTVVAASWWSSSELQSAG